MHSKRRGENRSGPERWAGSRSDQLDYHAIKTSQKLGDRSVVGQSVSTGIAFTVSATKWIDKGLILKTLGEQIGA